MASLLDARQDNGTEPADPIQHKHNSHAMTGTGSLVDNVRALRDRALTLADDIETHKVLGRVDGSRKLSKLVRLEGVFFNKVRLAPQT
jgi:hypothetical protein